MSGRVKPESHRNSDKSNIKYVGPPYWWAEMYTGHVTCCPLVSHDEYADWTDRWMDARLLHCAFC